LSRADRPRVLSLLCASLVLASSGCVSLARSEIGSAPPPETVARLEVGASFEEVIDTCGVPLETIEQPDGRLLIYRERHYQFRRFGFEPGLVIGLVDITGIVGAALANLNLVLEWGEVDERRLVVLFDPEKRMSAFAYRDVGQREVE
jgi:hypothetical protein